MRVGKFLTFLLFLSCAAAFGETFHLNGSNVVGNVQQTKINSGQNVADINRQYDIGFLELKEANPQVDFSHLPAGTQLTLPTEYILPNTPHHGIVINLSELRLYYYPPHNREVFSYPIGIGRAGDETPTAKTKIIAKREKPIWIPTLDMRKNELFRGIVLPKFVPPGSQNPLGDYSMRLELRNYLIHGTNDPAGVGLRISGGCIRMYPEDMKALYHQATIGTPVTIINQPVKLGWKNGILYAEVHVPTDAKHRTSHIKKNMMFDMTTALKQMLQKQPAEIDWDKSLTVADRQLGIPEAIGKSYKLKL